MRGQGCFVADITLPGELHAVLVRSPHAHARIRGIDSNAAARSANVVAILTGADMAADKVGPMAPLWAITSADGKPMAEPPRWALARETVRHVGEPVALVIAETLAQARDAADLVDVDYEPLPSVTDAKAAARGGRAAATRSSTRQYLLPLRARRSSRRRQSLCRRGARGAA